MSPKGNWKGALESGLKSGPECRAGIPALRGQRQRQRQTYPEFGISLSSLLQTSKAADAANLALCVQGPSVDSPPQQVAEGQALRLSQWHSIWLLLRTEIACFFRGPLSLSLCCDGNTIAPTGTPPGKGSLCLLNPSFIVGHFQMTTPLQRLFLSLLCCDCRKQTGQLVFKGEKEIRTDSELSSPAWYLGF